MGARQFHVFALSQCQEGFFLQIPRTHDEERDRGGNRHQEEHYIDHLFLSVDILALAFRSEPCSRLRLCLLPTPVCRAIRPPLAFAHHDAMIQLSWIQS